MATKSGLVLRDVDVLQECAESEVFISLASLSLHWHNTFEARSPSPRDRLRTIEVLTRKGIEVAVFVAPVLPAENDDMEALQDLLQAATSAGARLCVIGLGLPSMIVGDKETEACWPSQFSQKLDAVSSYCAPHENIAKYALRRLGPFAQASLMFPDQQRGLAILKTH